MYSTGPGALLHIPTPRRSDRTTIYHEQGLACGSHTGSYRSTMSKSKESSLT